MKKSFAEQRTALINEVNFGVFYKLQILHKSSLEMLTVRI